MLDFDSLVRQAHYELTHYKLNSVWHASKGKCFGLAVSL